MPKRGSESLTGGTGDVNPQWFNMVIPALTTSFATTTFSTPINKFPEGSGRVVIMEILKLFFHPQGVIGPVVAGQVVSQRIAVGTRNFSTTEPAMTDGTVLCRMSYDQDVVATTGLPVTPNFLWPFQVDLTDGAGHGMLVATDNIFVGGITTTSAVPYTSTWQVRALYRFKKVSLQEYIGIVQAQQSS